MDSSDKIREDAHKAYYKPPEEEGLINKELPIEMFENILSYLDRASMQSAAAVSKNWDKISIDVAKREENAKIKTFIHNLVENLDSKKYVEQITILSNLFSSETILNSLTLLDAKSSLTNLRESVLDVLKTIEDDDLDILEAISKKFDLPNFFEFIFDLSKYYKYIDTVSAITDEKEKSDVLGQITMLIAECAHWVKAVEVSRTIPHEGIKDMVLRDLGKLLIENGYYDKAVEVAQDISYDRLKSDLQYDILHNLIEADNIEKAKEFANTISDTHRRFYDVRKIVEKLVENDDVDQAIEVVNTLLIEDSRGRKDVLDHITKQLIDRGRLNKLVEVLPQLSFEDLDFFTQEKMVKAFVENGRIDAVIEVANKISQERKKNYVLFDIVKEVVENHLDGSDLKDRDFDLTVESISTIDVKFDEGLEYEKNIYLGVLASELMDKNNYDKAIELACAISEEQSKIKELQELVKKFIKIGDYDRATIAARNIPLDHGTDPHNRGLAQSGIVRELRVAAYVVV